MPQSGLSPTQMTLLSLSEAVLTVNILWAGLVKPLARVELFQCGRGDEIWKSMLGALDQHKDRQRMSDDLSITRGTLLSV